MTSQPTITIVLANRPRLFRELLQHALHSTSAQFRVVEATDGMPAASTLRDADWLIVDEETTLDTTKISTANPALGILALDGRGGRAQVLTPPALPGKASFSNVPTLAELLNVLSQPMAQHQVS